MTARTHGVAHGLGQAMASSTGVANDGQDAALVSGVAITAFAQAPSAPTASRITTITPLRVAVNGPIVHTVTSPFQRTATRIRVLLPNGYDPSRFRGHDWNSGWVPSGVSRLFS